jgi:prephenate dehydrogenase
MTSTDRESSTRDGDAEPAESGPRRQAAEVLDKVVIVGVGLIGGSIGQALRSRSLVRQVVGVGRTQSSLDRAVELGAIDRGSLDLSEAVAGAEVVVVCTPVDRVVEDLRLAAEAVTLAEESAQSVLLMDAGSCKRRIVEGVEAHPAAARMFVGAHPLAGSERAGVAHARPDLFEGRVCVLATTVRTPFDRLRRAHDFWSSIGSRVVRMTPTEHDEVVAFTSHLPHALAAALAATVPAHWHPFSAGAFRDGTRVAGADAGLWTVIFQDNRGNLIRALDSLQQSLDKLKYALMNDDKADIERWWEQARARRMAYEAEQMKAT